MWLFLLGFNATLFTRGSPGLLGLLVLLISSSGSSTNVTDADVVAYAMGFFAGLLSVYVLDSPRLLEMELISNTRRFVDNLTKHVEPFQHSLLASQSTIVLPPILHNAREVQLLALGIFLVLLCNSLLGLTFFTALAVASGTMLALAIYYFATHASAWWSGPAFNQLVRVPYDQAIFLLPRDHLVMQQNFKYLVIWALVTLPLQVMISEPLWALLLFPMYALAWLLMCHWTGSSGFSYQLPSFDRISNSGTGLALGLTLLITSGLHLSLGSFFPNSAPLVLLGSLGGSLLIALIIRLSVHPTM